LSRRLSTYYAVYYTASNAGNLLGEILMPTLRVHSTFYVIFSIVTAVGTVTMYSLQPSAIECARSRAMLQPGLHARPPVLQNPSAAAE
jgi:hypothetical protein